ncbi:hypothetical protein [Nucisporomicrobium flavum]|uniref:hypothetical protein n=1 Tax=Nucisporomicrobium flavum TaxID=2785915 RepID=UPI0027DDD130|nr:hypothetical protein [Nucisporomicrobium flavum]
MSLLEEENRLVLDVVQAALGLISPQIRALSVALDSGRVVLYVAVSERNAEVDEDIDDLLFELEALQDGPIVIESSIFVGRPDAHWPGSSGRRVYLAKEADS